MFKFIDFLEQKNAAFPKKKRKSPTPNKQIDDFIKEVDALQKELLASKSKKPVLPKKKDKDKVDIDDDLIRIAKTVFANLKAMPDYYTNQDRVNRVLGKEKETSTKKISKPNAAAIANDLGIDFDHSNFSAETFRKGIEAEYQKDNALDKSSGNELEDSV